MDFQLPMFCPGRLASTYYKVFNINYLEWLARGDQASQLLVVRFATFILH